MHPSFGAVKTPLILWPLEKKAERLRTPPTSTQPRTNSILLRSIQSESTVASFHHQLKNLASHWGSSSILERTWLQQYMLIYIYIYMSLDAARDAL